MTLDLFIHHFKLHICLAILGLALYLYAKFTPDTPSE